MATAIGSRWCSKNSGKSFASTFRNWIFVFIGVWEAIRNYTYSITWRSPRKWITNSARIEYREIGALRPVEYTRLYSSQNKAFWMELTLFASDKTFPVTELTLSVAAITFSETELTLSVTTITFSVTEFTVSVTTIVFSVAEFTLSVTDKTFLTNPSRLAVTP